MTDEAVKAAEAMREAAERRIRELYGHPLQEIVAGIRALPLPSSTAVDLPPEAFTEPGPSVAAPADPHDEALRIAREALRMALNAPDNKEEPITAVVHRAGFLGAALSAIEAALKGRL